MKFIDEGFLSELIQLRRSFHEIPELSYQEYQTTALIKSTLENWGLQLTPFKLLKTGGYCDIGKGPIITYRADIDALPIAENPIHSIVSKNPGFMHACGHDFHIVFGLALLKYFSQIKPIKNHTLRGVFQPAEEAYPTGAIKVCEENIWQNNKYFISAHISNDVDIGHVIVNQKVANAASRTVKILVKGRGGHTSRPFETDDIIRVTANYINQVYNYLEAKLSPSDIFVLAFGAIEGGSTHNIIPKSVQLKGTLRSFTPEVDKSATKFLQEFTEKYSDIYNISIKLEFPTYCPPVINDDFLIEQLRAFFQKQYPGKLIVSSTPSLGADDFALYLTKGAGIYLRIGGGGKGQAHSPDFWVNEESLKWGSEYLIGYINFLDQSS